MGPIFIVVISHHVGILKPLGISAIALPVDQPYCTVLSQSDVLRADVAMSEDEGER